MSGYMPSVDDVRHVYKFGALPEQADSRRVAAEMEREFNRWFAEVVRVAKREQLVSVIARVDASPAVTWTGRGGAKEIVEKMIEEQ